MPATSNDCSDCPDSLHLDIAIIGAGVAGLSAALAAPPTDKVGIFCKRPLGKAASGWAQGGIAASQQPADSPVLHAQDTLKAGDGLCRADTVDCFTQNAPAAIEWLQQLGVPFGCDKDGTRLLAQEGGHQKRRIAFVEDYTGRAITQTLIRCAKQRRDIRFYENYFAVDLIMRDNGCVGFYVLDIANEKILTVHAGAVILATGGAARLYLYSSTPRDATGDGVGLAFRAGAQISNMEFVQFHPTTLYDPHPPPLLISEALRGEGAKLVNVAGQSFIDHPDGELAPRDVVARSIDKEMKRSGADFVYLDCSYQPADFWQKRFPTIIKNCQQRGAWDQTQKIPVVPAAHYCCGGIDTDQNGFTNIPYLYAIGEAANNGLHGANRLASNSLLECVVAAKMLLSTIKINRQKSEIAAWNEERIIPPKEQVMIAHNWNELRHCMWNYVGIVRNDLRLQRARRRLNLIIQEIQEFYAKHRVSRDFLELRNLAQCAMLVVEGALQRRESRGIHYNLDCPQKMATAHDTVLSAEDFRQLRLAVNKECPFSHRPITAGSLTVYRDHVVGFCNPHCRDTFRAAVDVRFQGADSTIWQAKNAFDQIINHYF